MMQFCILKKEFNECYIYNIEIHSEKKKKHIF